jgi:hypothetical protein
MNDKPIRLIQLISEQTMPNLLPVLRLKPVHLTHFVTAKTAPRSAWIAEAARQAGIKPSVEIAKLSAMPAIPETFNAVKAAIVESHKAGQTPIVNFTGGTKLMSIGAFVAALHQDHKAASFYVDTEGETFVDGGTIEGLADLFEKDFSFTPLLRTLTVNTIAVANGRQRVTAGKDWTPMLPLAKHLFDNISDEEHTLDALHGPRGILPGGREPRRAGEWLAKLDQPVHLPAKVRDLAVAAGLLRMDGQDAKLPNSTRAELERLDKLQRDWEAQAPSAEQSGRSSRKPLFPIYELFKATQPLQASLAFLTGAWWEVVVADAAGRSGLFRDIRWSANVGQKGGADLEEDILAVDGVEIVCISCKRGGAKARLLPQLEELNARARSIGGNFTRRFLAVCLPILGRTGDNLCQRARELGINIIGPGDLMSPNAFARSQSNPR